MKYCRFGIFLIEHKKYRIVPLDTTRYGENVKPLDFTFLVEGVISSIRHDDMIQKVDAHQLTGVFD